MLPCNGMQLARHLQYKFECCAMVHPASFEPCLL
jgi:hypothetical protein